MPRKKLFNKLFNAIPVVKIAKSIKEDREKRKELRKDRFKLRQEAKTARIKGRLEARAGRAASRQEGRAARQQGRQANRLDKITQKRQAEEQIDEAAANQGTTPDNIGAAAIKQPKMLAKVKNYVKNQTGQPVDEDAAPEELAAQAQAMREEEVEDTQEMLQEEAPEGVEVSEEEAEQYCFDNDYIENYDGDDSEYYDPVTAAAAKAAAKKGLDIISRKRAAQGKKTFGMTPDELKKFWQPTEGKAATSDVGKVIEAAKGGAVEETTKDYTPIIIVFIVIIVGATIYFSKGK